MRFLTFEDWRNKELAKNQFKTEQPESTKEEKQSQRRKKGSRFFQVKEVFQFISNFIKDERQKMYGLIFILLFCIFVGGNFSSFFVHLGKPVSKVKLELSIGEFLWNPEM